MASWVKPRETTTSCWILAQEGRLVPFVLCMQTEDDIAIVLNCSKETTLQVEFHFVLVSMEDRVACKSVLFCFR